MSDKMTPEIRFKGFSDDWEQRKLGEVAIITMGQSPNGKNYTENPKDHILVQGNADMKNGKVVPRIWTTQITKIADKNDIILSVRAPVGDVGTTAYPIVLGRGVAGVKGNNFIFQILHKMKLMNFWRIYSTGSTFDSINSIDLRNATVSVPILKEQEQIGTFLKNLDNTIALHQDRLDKLYKLKKGFLQFMFPEDDKAMYPRLRFADFSEDWEQRKLGEISTSYSGGTPTVNRAEYYKGSLPFIRSGEINKNKTELYITEKGLSNSSAKMVNIGDILYALYGATSGEVGISSINGAINQAILVIKPKDNYNSQFITQYLMMQKQKIISKYLQGGQGNLSGSILKKLTIMLPEYQEQNKYALFLKKLDTTIALHQIKIKKIQQIKKAYLQKMFI